VIGVSVAQDNMLLPRRNISVYGTRLSLERQQPEHKLCLWNIYRMAHEKPARRLVDQRGRRSRTLYRKLTNANAKYLLVRECAENDLLVRQCTFVHAAAYCHTRDATQRCQFGTAELHRVYDNMLQRAQKCTDVQGDHFQHLL
jgi:hypothetical protein